MKNNKPKRVLILITSYVPFIGGAEVAVKEVTDRIDAKNYTFDLLTARVRNDLPTTEKLGKVVVHRVGGGSILDKYLLPFIGVFRIRRLLRKRSIDLFWCVEPSFAAGAAYIYDLVPFFRRIPVLLTQQSGQSEERVERGRGGIINLSWRLALKFTDGVTVISEYLVERTRRFGYRGEITVVPNGVDVQRFARKDTRYKIQDTKKKLGIKEGEKVVVTVSRLVEKNGIGDLVEAMKYLPDDVKLLIVGSGPLEEHLRLKAKTYNLEARIMFVGAVQPEEVPKYLSIGDVFCRPSLSEGMGNSFVEAMAARVPVVATPVGGIPDFLEDGVTGLFVEPENPKDIAEGIHELLDDELLREEVIEQARRLVEERHGWNKIAEQMKNVFGTVIGL